MASIGKDPGGRRRILFVAQNGKRRTIRLGKCSQKQAEGRQGQDRGPCCRTVRRESWTMR